MNFPNPNEFKKAIAATPNENFIWVIGGIVNIKKAGNYHMCINSDDGSLMWIDGRFAVNNDGLHGKQRTIFC